MGATRDWKHKAKLAKIFGELNKRKGLGPQLLDPYRFGGGGSGSYITPFYPTTLYSLRLRNAAYTGPCIRVVRSSDSTQTDIGFVAGDHLDVASLLAFVGSGNGGVVTWYDQSGNGVHVTNATGARIVTAGSLVTIGAGGHAAMDTNMPGGNFTASANAAFAFGSSPYTFEFIGRPTGANVAVAQVMLDVRNADNQAAFYAEGGNSPSLFNGINNSAVAGDIVNNMTAWICCSHGSPNLELYYTGTRDYVSAVGISYGLGNRPLLIAVGTTGLQWSGFLLEVRITKGVAKYTGSSVTPPDYYA